MTRLKKALSQLPAWIFTLITLLAILWLTLAPKPLGEEPPSFFPGADKVVHAIMFGGLTLVLLLDRQRKRGWKQVNIIYYLICATLSSILGIIIEYLQDNMELGRGFDFLDIVADIAGSYIFGGLYLLFQKSWSEN